MSDNGTETTAAAVAAAPAEGAERTRTRRACLVMLGSQAVAIDVAQAREVIDVDGWTPVPGAPAALLGVTNLRGTILPVVEVQAVLGLASRPVDGATRAIVLADGERFAGVVIDGVLGLEWYDEPLPLPEDLPSPITPFAAGLIAAGEGQVPILDVARLLAAVSAGWQGAADARKGG